MIGQMIKEAGGFLLARKGLLSVSARLVIVLIEALERTTVDKKRPETWLV